MSFEDKESVIERLESLYKTGHLSDATFLVGPEQKKVKAHRLLFAIASPVFYRMFFGALPERSEEIKVPDLTPSGFASMARYMYTDALPLDSVDHALNVLDSARKYMIPFLEKKCLCYLEENVCASSVVALYEHAKTFSYDSLTKRCLLVLQNETAKVVEGDDFFGADKSTLLDIARLPKLNLPSELCLFTKMEEWAKRQAETLGKELSELAGELSDIVGSIRFLTMSMEEFASGPADSPLLTSGEQKAIYKRFVTRGGGEYPERLSADTARRTAGASGGPTSALAQRSNDDRARTSATFSHKYDVSTLKKLNVKDKIYSGSCHYVSNVPWKFMVYKNRISYQFYLYTEDAQKMVKVPTVCKGRLLDQNGVELGMFTTNSGIKGWRDALNHGHRDGHLRLLFGWITHSTAGRCTSIVVEASVRE